MLFLKFSNFSRKYVVAFHWYFFAIHCPSSTSCYDRKYPDEVLFAGKMVEVCSVVISREYLYTFSRFSLVSFRTSYQCLVQDDESNLKLCLLSVSVSGKITYHLKSRIPLKASPLQPHNGTKETHRNQK